MKCQGERRIRKVTFLERIICSFASILDGDHWDTMEEYHVAKIMGSKKSFSWALDLETGRTVPLLLHLVWLRALYWILCPKSCFSFWQGLLWFNLHLCHSKNIVKENCNCFNMEGVSEDFKEAWLTFHLARTADHLAAPVLLYHIIITGLQRS